MNVEDRDGEEASPDRSRGGRRQPAGLRDTLKEALVAGLEWAGEPLSSKWAGAAAQLALSQLQLIFNILWVR